MKQTLHLKESELKTLFYEAVRKVKDGGQLNDVHNFNTVIDKSKKSLNESTINRMLQWLKNCDCTFITAFRNGLKDVRDENSTYFCPENNWKRLLGFGD